MILAFGEIMMRVAPEGNLRFRQAMPGKVDVTFAGGEANVCASLSMLGMKSRFLTAVPDHAICDAMVAVLRGLAVDTDFIRRRPEGRLGIYFLETGANQRGSNVIYDREGSTLSLTAPDAYDFTSALEGVTWVHLTGITPALSAKAFESTLALARLAHGKGIPVSCDLNFRKKLWRWKPGVAANALARECMGQILAFTEVVIANEEDAADVLGFHAEGTSVQDGKINAEAYTSVARKIAQAFPSVKKVAITLRESLSATHNNWGGMLYERATDRAHLAPLDEGGKYAPYEIKNIVDRVGGGDSFGAGLIYALSSPDYQAPGKAISFAVAASCLKHSFKGDFNFVSLAEVKALMGGQASGRVQR